MYTIFFFRTPQWSSDEKICARFLNGEVLFYENSNFDNIVHRIKGLKLNNYSISPGNQPLNVLCFLPGIYLYISYTIYKMYFVIFFSITHKIIIITKNLHYLPRVC